MIHRLKTFTIMLSVKPHLLIFRSNVSPARVLLHPEHRQGGRHPLLLDRPPRVPLQRRRPAARLVRRPPSSPSQASRVAHRPQTYGEACNLCRFVMGNLQILNYLSVKSVKYKI